MMCDICHKKNATVHLTEIVNAQAKETHICSDCSQAKAKELKIQFTAQGLNLKAKQASRGCKDSQILNLTCPACGLTLLDFKQKGRFGCEECYRIFGIYVEDLLKKIHGSISHCGKVYSGVSAENSAARELDELRQGLQRAIQLEEYEEAAHLRDRIQKLEKKAV